MPAGSICGSRVRYAGYGRRLTCAIPGYYSQCRSVTTSTIVKRHWHVLRMLSGAIPSTWALALAFFSFHQHCSILMIFGRNIPEKMLLDRVILFPTSTNWCFCTTWGNNLNKNGRILSIFLSLYCLILSIICPFNSQKIWGFFIQCRV